MGLAVLYFAFGAVALWLLGEVLLQYKARLRWRLLAFCGFLGVVVGVLLPSVVVIALGAIAFAVGQIYVTLSFRRGFAKGWSLGGKRGKTGKSGKAAGSKRRKGAAAVPPQPTLEVSELEYEPAPGAPAPDALDATAMMEVQSSGPGGPEGPGAPVGPGVYETEPVPDDTGQYGGYADAPRAPSAAPDSYAFDTYAAYDQPLPGGEQDPLHFAYGETGEQRYAAYSDPYIGPQTYGAEPGYDAYAPYGGDTYGGGYQDTPPGGVWVPHQRTSDAPPVPPAPYGAPPPQPPAYPPHLDGEGDQEPGNVFGYEPGYNGEQQYRY
ncbi:hypothetical protein [Streptomyces sp. G45]|uniref:hypothetical protein n=1 Tax=Streptomyces sp. G45 TaxID=3406627 RepID=UPI003C1E75BA